jgi:hypothetical protein
MGLFGRSKKETSKNSEIELKEFNDNGMSLYDQGKFKDAIL